MCGETVNPAEFIYSSMNGRLTTDDIKSELCLTFVRDYADDFSDSGAIKGSAYQTDYCNIVLDSMEGESNVLWCRDFSWKRCSRLEKVIDDRYGKYVHKNKSAEETI